MSGPATLRSDAVHDAATTASKDRPVLFAKIDAASSGDNTLVAAVSGRKIRVLALWYVVGGAVNTRFESGAGGTALTGVHEHNAKGEGLTLPFSPAGWLETAAGELLNLELSGAISADGGLVYITV